MKIDIHTHILPKHLPKWKEKFGYGGFIELDHFDASHPGSAAAHSQGLPSGHSSSHPSSHSHGPGRGAQCRARMLKDDGEFFREIDSNTWDSSARLEDCERSDVDAQVLSTVPVMFSYWAKPKDGLEVARFLNDDLANTVAKHPERFVGLGTLPLQDPELAIGELERCVKDLGFKGVQIGSHVNHWNLSDPALFPVFEAANRLGASIFVHPWDMMGQDRMQKYWLPWLVGMPAEVSLAICSMIFGGVFERLPDLRVAFAHGGGAFGATLGRIEHGFNSRPDLCAIDNSLGPREYLGRFYVDSLVHDKQALRYLLETYGERCIALGSDYPFPLGEQNPGELIDSLEEMTPAIRERLFSGTALEWLGLTPRIPIEEFRRPISSKSAPMEPMRSHPSASGKPQ